MPSSVTGYALKIKEGLKGRGAMLASLLVFLVLGVYLFRFSLPDRDFSEEGLIYDTIWLDAWSLGFILVHAILWLSNLSWRTKALIGVLVLGIYGFIEIGLIFNGTPFSSYGYWGDQKFRQAMILKFMELGYPTDFYFKSLPPFYPPLLYLVFAGVGKVLSLPAYYLLKIGGMLIFLCGPLLLYWLWRPLAGSLGAWLVVLFTYLVCASPTPYVLTAPHAFVATAIFIPWWLRFVDGVHGLMSRWRHWLIGGALGAVILSTYFYPLMVGAFLIGLLAVRDWHRKRSGRKTVLYWRRVLGVVTAALVLSSWYWLPAAWSVVTVGIDRSRGGWHHIDSTSIGLLFTSFSWTGVLFLGGIVFALSRWRSRIHRSLLILLAVVIPYLFVGSLLGGLDYDINLVKARDMVNVFAGPFIGLAAAVLLRRRQTRQGRWIVPVLTAVALLVLCHQFNEYAKTDWVKTARTAYAPTWGTDASEMKGRAGSVFLCGHETFPSFFPVYTFLAANEHYSHPACRFKRRYDLLDLLEKIDDPRVINIALRTNRFDKVDFFMPHRDGSVFDITISLSNYPDRYSTRVFKYPDKVVSDTNLFCRLKGDDLYAVLEPIGIAESRHQDALSSGADTLLQNMRLTMIRDQLDVAGQVELDKYLGVDWSNWRKYVGEPEETVFGDSVVLKDFRIVNAGDSMHLLMAFEAIESLSRQFRVMVHLFVDDQMSNFDFSPVPATDTWQRYEAMLCRQTIPNPGRPFLLYIGMFDRLGNLPGVLQLNSSPEE
jgi:hypothetical protein